MNLPGLYDIVLSVAINTLKENFMKFDFYE